MPRTKYTRKPKGANDSLDKPDRKLKTFERHVQNSIVKLEQDAQADVRSFETLIDVMISRLPVLIRQMTLNEILALGSDDLKENCKEVTGTSYMRPPTVTMSTAKKTTKTAVKRATAASDDGYATEGGTSVGSSSRGTKVPAPTTRRTRSSSRTNKALSELINQKIVMKKPRAKSKQREDHLNVTMLKTDNFKTPGVPRSVLNAYDVVTPKIKPNTPMNVLRRPRAGEMVLSMQGSPLLVSAVIEEKTANVNVPLSNGNMMSLLPQEGLRMSHIPPLDSETMHQLETLKKHIEKVIAQK